MVYVDYSVWEYGRMKMCHMIADTEKELYDMADKIGIDKKWYQKNHFDICLSKKKLAIKNGAIEISPFELVKKLKEIKEAQNENKH